MSEVNTKPVLTDEMVVKERIYENDICLHCGNPRHQHKVIVPRGAEWCTLRADDSRSFKPKLKVENGATNETKRCHCGSEVCVGADHIRVGFYCARRGEAGNAVAPSPTVEPDKSLSWEAMAGAIIDTVHLTNEDYVNEKLVEQLKRFFGGKR
jgi:hypothetical protein